jgi:hypothetical protein
MSTSKDAKYFASLLCGPLFFALQHPAQILPCLINYFISQSKLPEAPDGGGDVQLVAVSKFQSNDAIMAAYEAGQRVFGENYVQELVAKAPVLPADIRWHFIGTLQSNKAKGLIAGLQHPSLLMTFVSLFADGVF